MTDFSVKVWVCWALQSPGSTGLPVDCMQACRETLDLLDCPNFRNFTHDDRCTLA